MKKVRLNDGTQIFCLKAAEAKVLDHHTEGYLQHGVQINDGDVILDIGANIGVFGIRAIQKFEKVQVHAFEPIPDIFAVLKANAEKFDKNRFRVHQFGIATTNEEVVFSYFPNTPALSSFHMEDWDKNPSAFKEAVKGSMKNPPQNMKWMRLIPPVFAGAIAKKLLKGKKQIHCLIRNTSDVIQELKLDRVDLLKVDCEGAELEVIQGISNTDWHKIKSVVIEVHDNDNRLKKVSEILENAGFKNIHIEKEKGLESTGLYNIFATRL